MSKFIILDNVIEERTCENIYNNVSENYRNLATSLANHNLDWYIGEQLVSFIEQQLPMIGTPSFSNINLIETRSQIHVKFQVMKSCMRLPQNTTHAMIISIKPLLTEDWPINIREDTGVFTPYKLLSRQAILYNTSIDVMSLTIQPTDPTDIIVRFYLYYNIS